MLHSSIDTAVKFLKHLASNFSRASCTLLGIGIPNDEHSGHLPDSESGDPSSPQVGHITLVFLLATSSASWLSVLGDFVLGTEALDRFSSVFVR